MLSCWGCSTSSAPSRDYCTFFSTLQEPPGATDLSWFEVLLQHEKIRECAVVGKPDETWGEKAWAKRVELVKAIEGVSLGVVELIIQEVLKRGQRYFNGPFLKMYRPRLLSYGPLVR